MIAKFFQKSEPQNTFVLIILLLIFYIVTVFQQGSFEFSILNIIKEIGFFCWFALFLLIIDFIIRKNALTSDNSFALFFLVMFFGSFQDTFLNSKIIYTNLALLLAFRKMYSLRSNINLKKKLFDGGFWVGIASLFYSGSAIFLLLLLASVFFFRKNGLKNILMPVIGFFAPIVIYDSYQLFIGKEDFFFEKMSFDFKYSIAYYLEVPLLMPLVLLIVLSVISILWNSPKFLMVSNNFKSSWNVILTHFVISLALVLITNEKNGSELMFLFFPSAILIVNFTQKKGGIFLKNVLLYTFLGIAIWSLSYNF